MPVIELKEVSKLYGFGDATTIALEEITLRIEKGEFIAVMGPSGSGKSTLMHIIGLLDKSTHGDYLFNGRHVSSLGTRRRARIRRDAIGFVFQASHLLPRLTVLENVALPLAYKGMTQTRRLKQAGAMLEQLGLGDREYFLPGQLSGGQAQRVAIARALVNNPSIIIADEPTGNLDSASSRLVMEQLSELHQLGHTILLVTHNPELTRYATRVIFMRDGTIMADKVSKVGEIPAMARRLYFMPRKTVEDDLAGVSELMKALPGHDTKEKVARKPKRTKTKSFRRTLRKRSKV
jgi:putative ABC transport system ATP-binding protein